MIGCTGLGLVVNSNRYPGVVNWSFIVKGENKGIFERIEGLEYSSVIRGQENYSYKAHEMQEDISVWMLGVIHNKKALWNTVLEKYQYPDNDVDLLINLIRSYGPTALRLVNGRFSAIIRYKSNLYLVTDHAGTVPLYFNISNNSIYVSTEAKALIHGAKVSSGLRPFSDRIYDRNVTETVFQNINRVPVGTIVVIDLKTLNVQTKSYWQMPSDRLVISEKKACDLVFSTLNEAVEHRVKNDEPIGVILSGGIDSSAITSLAAPKVDRLHTFSIGTETINEFEYAKLVADRYKTDHHELLINEENFLEKLPHVVWATEIPYSDFIEYLLPVYVTYEKISPFTQNILTGYGSDILFGGMWDPKLSINELDEVIEADIQSIDGSNEFTHTIGLVHGIWTEHPFWDRDFLRVALQLDPRLKNLNGIEKYILRKSFESVLPQKNVWRKKIGVHQSTGTESAFTKWVNEKLPGPEPIKYRKDIVIYNLLKILYEENCNPNEIDINTLGKIDLKIY